MQPRFPIGKAIAMLSAIAAAMLVIELLTVPAMFGSPAGATTAVLIMGGFVWFSGVLSLLLMKRNIGSNPLEVVKIFFMGMGVRVLMAVVMIIIAVKVMKLPAGPVAVATMMMYLPLLFAETRMMVAHLKSMNTGGPSKPSAMQSPSTPVAGSHANDDQTTAPCTEALA